MMWKINPAQKVQPGRKCFDIKFIRMQKLVECIFVLDTLKFLIQVAWEGKLITHKQYEEISMRLDEVGKMLGGWKKSLANPEKKNRAV